MATPVVMPKQGQSVESCIIVEWKKEEGDPVQEGDVLCEVETDKAVMEVESPVSGTLLARFYPEGELVPVLTNIAAIGTPGEDISHLRPQEGGSASQTEAVPPAPSEEAPVQEAPAGGVDQASAAPAAPPQAISPRARNLAARRQIDLTGVQGTGPGGRIIERDVEAALAAQPRLSPVAKAMVETGGYRAPGRGTGPGGRVMSRDLEAVASPAPSPAAAGAEDDVLERIPVRGIRKVIAERMLHSLQSTAQLTLHASADARALLAYRRRLKESEPALELQGVTINDLVLFAVSRVLLQFPDLNAWYDGETITRYRAVHLGFAVDTPRGLMVPVIRRAQVLSLRELSRASKRLSTACQEGSITPDELNGGTFTVTNLGSLGIERFTPILNPPQVAILGVGSIELKAVEVEGEVQFIPHLGLSLTLNHQAVDGAPGARFLQALARGIAGLETLLAL